MIRPAYFVWIVVPIALYLAYQVYGWPYLNWSYDFRSAGGYDPFAERYYTRCTYWNPTGTHTIHPSDGNCPRIKFFNHKGGGN